MGLSKTQMRDVIEAGGSVKYKGKLITRVDQLIKVDGTDSEKQSEIADLEKRLGELRGNQTLTVTDENQGGQAGENGEGEGEGESADDAKAKELMKHTRQELLMKANEIGIEVAESDTKAEIVEKILAKGK